MIHDAERPLRLFSLQLDTHGTIDLLGRGVHLKQVQGLLPDLGCGRADRSDCLLGGDFNSFFGGNEQAVAVTRDWFG
ncbi:MAG: hypothetical protein ACRD1V_19865, partial [Vicinamibacterales bacterium]